VLAKHLPRIVSVFFISISIPCLASETELSVAKTREGVVGAGKPQSYELVLNAGDYAEIKVDPRGKELTLIAYDPSGRKFRGTKLGPEEDKFDFVVDGPGQYRLEVTTTDHDVDRSYAITLERIVSLQARLHPLKPAYESPRINALRAAVAAGKPGSIDSFWEEVEKEGAPIIEPLRGDDKNMLVTFLWRGSPDTRTLFVARCPMPAAPPTTISCNISETPMSGTRQSRLTGKHDLNTRLRRTFRESGRCHREWIMMPSP
jgi:hypothetical protein